MRTLVLVALVACSFKKPTDVVGDGGNLLGDASQPVDTGTSIDGSLVDGSVTGDGAVDGMVDSGIVMNADASTDASTDAPIQMPQITSFKFEKTFNHGLAHDILGTITGNTIDVSGFGIDPSALKATFTATGSTVQVGSTTQTSTMSANNFTNPVSYQVIGSTTANYTVKVHVRSFAATQMLGATATPTVLAVGDLDNDGKPDIVVAIGTTISVMHNTTGTNATTPTFTAIPSVAASANQPVTAIALADMDGDSHLDLVVTTSASSGALQIFLNKNTPTISFATTPISFDIFGSNLTTVAAGDLDGDTKVDLVVGGQNGLGIHVGLNKTMAPGSVQFQSTATFFPDTTSPVSVQIVRWDNDTKPDVVVAEIANGVAFALISTTSMGAMTWTAQPSTIALTTSGQIEQFAIADFDADTKSDFVASNNLGGTARLDLLAGDDLGDDVQIAAAGQTNAVVAADLDGDGRLDLVSADLQGGSNNGLFEAFVNTGDSTTSLFASPALDNTSDALAPAKGVVMVKANFTSNGLPGFACLFGASVTSNVMVAQIVQTN